jgi:hypothetical protein
MELEKGRPDTVVVFVFGGLGAGFLAGVEGLLRALKGLLELWALIPGVVAVDDDVGPMERDGVATAEDDVSGAVKQVSVVVREKRSRLVEIPVEMWSEMNRQRSWTPDDDRQNPYVTE